MSASQQKKSIEFNLKLYREEAFWIISLKNVTENLNLVKSYDKTNSNVFVFSLRDKYRWGLTSFGQYIWVRNLTIREAKKMS